jgi:hypothetical protein
MAQRRSPLADFGSDPYGQIFGPQSLSQGPSYEASPEPGLALGEEEALPSDEGAGERPSREADSPRDRVTTGGPAIQRIPPSSGIEDLLSSDMGGGQATPTRPRTPAPMAEEGSSAFLGGSDPNSRLFGRAGGLLEGGLGVPDALGGGASAEDPSALIEQLLAMLGGGAQRGF